MSILRGLTIGAVLSVLGNKKKTTILLILATSFLSTHAHSTLIGINDFSSSATHITFEDMPYSSGRQGPVYNDGLTFESGGNAFRTYPGSLITQPICSSGCIMTDIDLDYIYVDMLNPVGRIGGTVGVTNQTTTATVEFISFGEIIGTVDVSTTFRGEGVFAGWEAEDNIITAIRFVDTDAQDFVLALSQLSFETITSVPEPASLALVGLGLVGLGIARRRKQA